ncbi:hypothetical protein U1Q18_033582 [Sarracenia purpurea var. burkii]
MTVASKAIPVSLQPDYFRDYVERLKGVVGEEEANDIIKDSLALINSGSNDVTVNFYDFPTRRIQYFGINGYHDFLQRRLQDFVKINIH